MKLPNYHEQLWLSFVGIQIMEAVIPRSTGIIAKPVRQFPGVLQFLVWFLHLFRVAC